MAAARTRQCGFRLGRGATLAGVETASVDLDDCSTITWGPPDDGRPLIEHVTVKDLRLFNSHLSGAVLRDVLVDGLKCDSMSMFFNGNEFEHVTLRGKIGTVILNSSLPAPEWASAYAEAVKRAEAAVDWTVDISEAIGVIEVRGYAADKFRRNPETQVVVRRVNLEDGRWRSINLEGTTFGVALTQVLDNGWSDTILTANALRKHDFAIEMRVLQQLRDEGIADPE